MMLLKNDITHAAGSLQLSAGEDAGVEAVVHAMHDIFSDENIKAVLLIDAENAFNSINRKVMLHNMKFLCPFISTYIYIVALSHQQGSSFLTGVKYNLKKGQPRVIRL